MQYLHLKDLGYKVYVGNLPSGEVDFVAEKNGKTTYFQIAYMLTDEKTMEQEFGNLLAIKDNYPKYVISMDPISKPKGYEGIIHLSLRQMLTTDSF